MAPPATGDELDCVIDVTKETAEVAAAGVIVEEVEALLADDDNDDDGGDKVKPFDSECEALEMAEVSVCWTGSPTARVV
jgi:hypothetical protein